MLMRSDKHYGFVKRLLIWAGSAALIVTILSVVSLFIASYHRAFDEQDDLLEEVTGVLARLDVSRRNPGALWMDDDDFEDWFTVDDHSPESVAKAGSTILVRTLHGGGKAIRVIFDQDLHNGHQTLLISGTPYRLNLLTLSNGQHIAVAQKTKEIEKIARTTALAAILPLLGLSFTIFVILAFLLWYSMRPIRDLTSSINKRQPDDLTPIDPQGLPSELLPLVEAFNGILEKIKVLRENESRFVADATHELRSPLAALSLQAERLQSAALTPQTQKQVQELRQSIDRAVCLVSQLLSLKRAQQDKVTVRQKPANLSETLSMVIEQIWGEAEKKNIEIEATGFDELDPQSNATVNIGEEDLFSLLRNLMENAVKYCPSGSQVSIELVSLSPFEINIRDNGPGLSDEDKARVFDPFYRVLGTGVTGTGLGMAIVKSLAQRNHIEITLSDAYPNAPEGSKGLLVHLKQKSHFDPKK